MTRKVLKTILLAAMVQLIAVSSVNAAVLTSSFMKETIESAVARKIKEKTGRNVEVHVGSLPYKRIEVPGNNPKLEVELNTDYISSKTVVKVNVLVNGEAVRTFGVPVNVTIEDSVWVATEIIEKGKAFNYQNIKFTKKDITNVYKDAAGKDFSYEGYRSGKTYRSGEIINRKYVQRAPDVLKNSTVSVIFDSDDIKLVIEAQALEDGEIGDYIRVKSLKYKKEYTGKVINSNQVLVKM